MKAMIWINYGPPEVLQLQEVAKPAPRDHEVLNAVYSSHHDRTRTLGKHWRHAIVRC